MAASDGRRGAQRQVAAGVAALGILLALAALPVRPFAGEAAALFAEPRAVRFFSCLYDHGSIGTSLTGGWAYWSPPNSVQVVNVVADRCPVSYALYVPRISDAEIAWKVAAAAQVGPPCPYVRVGEGVVFGNPDDKETFLSVFEGFDPVAYPANPEAVGLVLRKAAARDWRHNIALRSHHGGTALLLLPVEGFSSLCRLAATPLLLDGGPRAAASLGSAWTLAPGLAVALVGALLWVRANWGAGDRRRH